MINQESSQAYLDSFTRIATMSNSEFRTSGEEVHLWENNLLPRIASLDRRINTDLRDVQYRVRDFPEDSDSKGNLKFEKLEKLATDREKELKILKEDVKPLLDKCLKLVENPEKNKAQLKELNKQFENSKLNTRVDEAHRIYEVKKLGIETGTGQYWEDRKGKIAKQCRCKW